MIDFKLLKEPFKESEIEWRIGRAGKKGNGTVWATCLAYVQSRAIMDRLDEVCGPENWRVSYSFISASQGTKPGVIANIEIRRTDDGTWISKQDGAEQTDIESFKGGLSSALKRAGVVWGIGRYLYGLEEGWAVITQQGFKDARYSKLKEGGDFYWLPPSLPQWALPSTEVAKTKLPEVRPQEPSHGDGFAHEEYRIDFGKYAKRSLAEVGADHLRKYVEYLESTATPTKPLSAKALDFIDRASDYIAAFENSPG